MAFLAVLQERSSLLISRDERLLSSEADLLPKQTRNADDERRKEESGHDCESKYPLEGNCLRKKLPNAKGSC